MTLAKLRELDQDYIGLSNRLKLNELETELVRLTKESQEQNFWSDNLKAQATMKQLAKLKQRLDPWLKMKTAIKDLKDMADLDDKTIEKEIVEQVDDLNKELATLKEELKFSGHYDSYDAIL